MIDEVRVRPAPPPSDPDRRRRWWLASFALLVLVGVGVTVGRRVEAPNVAVAAEIPATAPPVEERPAKDFRPPAASLPTAGVLQTPGSVPTHGSSKFSYAGRRGPVIGSKGPVRRFKVAVEQGSGENAAAFAAVVAATLGDPRSWAGSGRVRLQQVGAADRADFTVYLATRDTAGRMCRRGGTDIRVAGKPYTSCRTVGKAIINLDRWRRSADPYLKAEVPLATYRQYVINHEVGHELGHHHEGCPAKGGPAPVMVQQTLTLRGCVPYAWPLRNGRMLTGPSL